MASEDIKKILEEIRDSNEKLGKSIEDSFQKFGKNFKELYNSLDNILLRQRNEGSSFPSNYRGRSFRYGNSDVDIDKKLERIERDLEVQKKDTKNATSLRRVFGGFNESGNRINEQKRNLDDAIEDIKRAKKTLSNTLKENFNIDSSVEDVIEKAKEKFDSLTDSINEFKKESEEAKDNLKSLLEPIESSLSDEDIEKLESIDFTKAFDFDKDGNVISTNIEKFKSLEKLIENTPSLKDKISSDDIEKIAEAQYNTLKTEEKLKKTEEERKDLGEEILNVYENTTEELREQTKLADLSVQTMKDGVRGIKEGARGIAKLADGWLKVDKAASNFAKNIGVGSKGIELLRKNTEKMVANGIGLKYDIGMEELVEIQQNYAQGTGRNIGMTSEDVETSAAMSRVMGTKGGELATALENFGLSYTESGKRAGKMFETASKYGLTFEKYSQNFLTNIKLAQNYTFRDGLRGLERMAAKSTAIKLDMQQIASFADKVSSLQGAVETSASLQVLGGPFAQFADPLGMLNEGLNNMEGLMDRFQGMTKNLGKFNAETGQVEVSAFNKQRVKAAAQAMGMDYNQVMESVQSQGRREYIAQQLNNRNLSEEEQEFVKNTATVQNGQAQMTFFDEKGNKVTKDVNKMTKKDIQQARAQNQSDSDNIKTIAKTTLSLSERIEGFEKMREAVIAEKIEPVMNTIKDKAEKATEHLGVIKGIVMAIAAATAVGNLVKIGKGGVDIFRGVKGFLNSGKVGKIAKSGWSKVVQSGRMLKNPAAMSKLGNGSVLRGAGKLLTSGAGTGAAIAAGAAITIAGVAKGIHDIKIGNEIKKGRDSLVGSGKIKKGSEEDKKLTIEKNKEKGKGIGTASATALGAAIGSFILPGIGTAIGAGIGWLGGHFIGKAVGKKVAEKENKKRHEEAIVEGRLHSSLERAGFNFKGGYNEEEYKKIISAINNGGDNTITKAEFESLPEELRKKMQESGDVSLFGELEEFVIDEATVNADNVILNANGIKINKDGSVEKKANGGLLNGPSHANGGMPIVGSNIEVEGGEFVVNKHAAKQNLGLLTSINKMGEGGVITPREDSSIKNINTTISKMSNGGIIAPREDNSIKPVKVLPITNASINSVNKTSIEPININISGTIKLDGGNGKEIDMNALLKDPTFIRNITNLIEQQMIYNIKGARYTDKLVK